MKTLVVLYRRWYCYLNVIYHHIIVIVIIIILIIRRIQDALSPYEDYDVSTRKCHDLYTHR